MKFILKHKYIMPVLFLIMTAVSLVASSFVKVDYDLVDYLPDDSPSTIALDTMENEYKTDIPNARVMVPDVSLPEALSYKEKFKAVDGVKEVSWLDDAVNVYQPLDMLETKTVEEYYKDGNALFTVTIDDEKKVEAVNALRKIIGDGGAMSGTAVNNAAAIQLTEKEVQKIMVFCVILIFFILIFATTSYVEPIIFLVTIGVAIAINRGTNLFFGEISFVTNSAGSILQLAVSMDYSIFIMHRFQEFRETESDVEKAMSLAVKKSFASVMSSGLTTVMGFAALVLMKFKIGPDMGWVMAKAIAISLITVLLFLPSLILVTYKLIDKTEHKNFMPSFEKLSKAVFKVSTPVILIFAILLVPCYIAQGKNSFRYGQSGIYGKGTQLGDDTEKIENIFGQSNLVAIMVPKGKYATEAELTEQLESNPYVTSVISYSESVGYQIPEELVPKDSLDQLISKDYSRFVVTLDAPAEGKFSFSVVNDIKKLVKDLYGDKGLVAGDTVSSYDLKGVVTSDNTKVNFLAILSIALILVINFKSIMLPVILLVLIELSIWINLAVPYFAGDDLFYIGYLIISSIQLGATVDYAILFADRYIENRHTMLAKPAAQKTLQDTAPSVITSATILTASGLSLGMMSTNGVISQLGILVGRGGILSGVLVLFALPPLIAFFDGAIRKTTYKMKVYTGEEQEEVNHEAD